MPRFRSAATAIAAQFFAVAFAGTAVQAGELAPPRFEEAACDTAALSPTIAPRVRCGTVAVPRVADSPATGSYRLKVTVLKAVDQPALSDAVVLLFGEPGEASPDAEAYTELMAIFPGRDVVLIDPRGTGDSEPKACAGLNLSGGRFSGPRFTDRDYANAVADAGATCLTAAAAQGDQPAAFGARVSAQDADRVRLALGYEKLNLVGAGYGATVALELSAQHPETVRSLVLDSPYIGTLAPLSGLENWARARQALLAECDRDSFCSAAYPELVLEFDHTLAGLRDTPLAVPVSAEFGAPGNVVVLDPVDFETLIFSMSYDRADAGRIPALIRSAAQGRSGPIAQALMKSMAQRRAVSAFAFFAGMCRDGSAVHEAGLLGPVGEQLGISLAAPARSCGTWAGIDTTPTLPGDARFPVLTLSGLLDPIVPPANARTIAAYVGPAVRQIEFPSVGHGVMLQSPCAVGIVQQFIDAPTGPIDASCLRSAPPVEFRAPMH